MAAKNAGMSVVAVPSIPKQADRYSFADEVINSLLDLHPEKWSLPPFKDCMLLKPYIFSFPTFDRHSIVAHFVITFPSLNYRDRKHFTY